MGVVSLCGTTGGRNTGKINCDVRRGVPKILLIGGGTFEPADYATAEAYEAAVLEKINLPNGDPQKLYPFPEVQNVTNNTEANTTGTTGLGFQMILREGKPAYQLGVIIGSSLEKALRTFNNQILPVYVFDSNRNNWGKVNNSGIQSGVDHLMFTQGKPYSDGSSVDTEYTNIVISALSASDMYDDGAFVSTSFSLTDLEGLLDVELRYLSNVTNVFQIDGVVPTTKLNDTRHIYDTYPTQLADEALWEAFTGTTFSTPLAITSVAGNAATHGYTVTLDTTAYAALPAASKILLRLVTPALLAAADAPGIEGISVILTKS